MVIGPVASCGSSPGLPMSLDNNSCTPTPNPSTTPGEIDDGASPNHQTNTNINNNSSNVHNNNINNLHTHHQHQASQQLEHQEHQHHHHHHSTDSPNDQSSLILLQPSGVGVTSEIGTCTPGGISGYSPMLPSFNHYAPGKLLRKLHP